VFVDQVGPQLRHAQRFHLRVAPRRRQILQGVDRHQDHQWRGRDQRQEHQARADPIPASDRALGFLDATRPPCAAQMS
jgi:hypothetical protein